MLAIGLTGGIGCGKSTVARMLVEKGAVLIDADAVAREVVEPGGPAYQPLIERFGRGIVSEDGTIDRKALAALAFSEPTELEALNAITHPAIGTTMLERRLSEDGTDHVVLLDIPLLKPAHRDLLTLDAVVVVDCPADLAIERLVGQRGFDRLDAQARASAQITREERLEGADFVVDNSGDDSALASQVDDLWRRFVELERHKDSAADQNSPA